MPVFLSRYSDVTYALLRFVAGAMFAFHGAQKLFGFPSGQPVPLQSMMGFAGVIELVGGALVAVGLFAGWAAFLCSGQMAVAYFMVHARQALWPIENKGELAVLYCFVFLYIASRGSGAFSLDAAMRKPRRA
jgi:putative oxidoreductase